MGYNTTITHFNHFNLESSTLADTWSACQFEFDLCKWCPTYLTAQYCVSSIVKHTRAPLSGASAGVRCLHCCSELTTPKTAITITIATNVLKSCDQYRIREGRKTSKCGVLKQLPNFYW